MLDRKYPEWGKNTEGKRFHACRWNPIFLIRHSFERFKVEYWNFLTTSSQKQRQSLRSSKMPALCLVLLETLAPLLTQVWLWDWWGSGCPSAGEAFSCWGFEFHLTSDIMSVSCHFHPWEWFESAPCPLLLRSLDLRCNFCRIPSF